MLVKVVLGNPVVVGYLTLPVRNQCVVDDVFHCYGIAGLLQDKLLQGVFEEMQDLFDQNKSDVYV